MAATADQLKLLVKAHYSGDAERFNTLILQIAAAEATKGHVTLARELKAIVDSTKITPQKSLYVDPEIDDLLILKQSNTLLSDLIIKKEIEESLRTILKEYYNRHKLSIYNISNRKKLLLAGPPGTGKTLTASALANELKLPLYIVQTDKIITKYLGETSQKLSKVFAFIETFEAVYLFDEFDSIASERNFENDIGEIRRVINSFLQQIETSNKSFIIGATNNPQLLDKAIFRRFDDIIFYDLPDANQRKKIIKNNLSLFIINELDFISLGKISKGLSHAELINACKDVMKDCILNDSEVTTELVIKSIEKRKLTFLWGN
ncbi:AAA family ATPase [Lysinibacillus sphaericus]|uniref:AAA family ATPase n=1 Tax=Lysinibacillus sphaericus TaxID=1421 RepID=UPI001CC18AC8|nr:ATP-binding protein [Lysinibacillus sphaericus]